MDKKTLYDTLSSDPDLLAKGDNNFGEFDEFSKAMDDADNVKSVYDYLSGKGTKLGTLEDFSAGLSAATAEAATPNVATGADVATDVAIPQEGYFMFSDEELSKRKADAEAAGDIAAADGDVVGMEAADADAENIAAVQESRVEGTDGFDVKNATDEQLNEMSDTKNLDALEGMDNVADKRSVTNRHWAAEAEKLQRTDARSKGKAAGVEASTAVAHNLASKRESNDTLTNALSRYDKLMRPYKNAYGEYESISANAIGRHYSRYNDNIRANRDLTTDQLWHKFVKVMDAPYRSEEERAVDSIPIIQELYARERGGQVKTIGEQNIADWMGVHGHEGAYGKYGGGYAEGTVKWHYDQYMAGSEGHVSDFNRDREAAFRDIPIFALSDKAVSIINERLNDVASRYENRVVHSAGESVDLSEYRDAVKSMNVTEAIREAMAGYDKSKLKGYIAAFAEKNDMTYEAAEARVNQLIVEDVLNNLGASNKPTSNADYWLREVLTNNFAAQLVKAAATLSSTKPGDIGVYQIEQKGNQMFLAEHKDGFVNNFVQVSAELGKFVMDGWTGAFKIPGLASRGMSMLLGGFTEAGERALLRSAGKRAVNQIAGGAANFMAYQTQMASLDMLRSGDYSWQNLAIAAYKGAKEGAIFGAVGTGVDRIFMNAKGWMVPLGETLKFVGEGGTFATFGYLESPNDFTIKDLASSFGMAMMPRMQHFSQWAHDVDARFHGKEDYGKKIRVHQISKEEQADLEGKGYTYIAMALRGSRLTKGDEEHLSRELADMRKDDNVSWEYVRMADWVLNGKIEAVPPVLGYKYEERNGRYTITPTDENGRAINGYFTTTDKAAFDTERKSIEAQANANSLHLAELNALTASADRALGRAVVSWVKDGDDPNAVYRIYKEAERKAANKEKLGTVEKEVYDGVNSVLRDTQMIDDAAAYKAVIKRTTGVDIDSLVKRHPDDWSEKEQDVMDKYTRFLTDRQHTVEAENAQEFLAWVNDSAEREAAEAARTATRGANEANEANEATGANEANGADGTRANEAAETTGTTEAVPEANGADGTVDVPVTEMVSDVRGTERAERIAENGEPAHYDDVAALFPEDVKNVTAEELGRALTMLEEERAEAHRYANGEIAEEPANFKYWAVRDGLTATRNVATETTGTTEANAATTGTTEATGVAEVNGVERPEVMGMLDTDADYWGERPRRTVRMIDKAAKALGLRIRLVDIPEQRNENGEVVTTNGYYEDGTIFVNRNQSVDKTLGFVFGHEMTHHLKARGADAFDSFSKTVIDHFINEYGFGEYSGALQDIIADNKTVGKDLSIEDAKEEFTCDRAGEMLTDEAEMRRVLRSVVDRSTFEKVKDAVLDFYDRMLETFDLASEERQFLIQRRKDFQTLFDEVAAERANKEKRNEDAQARGFANDAESEKFNKALDTLSDPSSPEEARKEADDVIHAQVENMGGVAVDGKPQRKFSTSSMVEGAGLRCLETDEEGVKRLTTDEEGNVVFRLGDKEFDHSKPVTVSDLKGADSTLNLIIEDSLNYGLINESQAENIYGKYADILNLYLTVGKVRYEDGKKVGGATGLSNMWELVGDSVFRTISKNSDKQYLKSIDITRVCKKNEAMINAISELQLQQNYGVTPSQILNLYYNTVDAGFQAPCPVCYVFSRYIENGRYATASVNGFSVYGDHLPDGKNPWTVDQWVEEMEKVQDLYDSDKAKEHNRSESFKERAKANHKAYEWARTAVTEIPDMMDDLRFKLLLGVKSKAERARLEQEISSLDKDYRRALDIWQRWAMSNWIKAFVIRSTKEGWVMREDAAMPKDMDDFRAQAMDLRRTSETMMTNPGIQRMRKSAGSAGGKEITFASDNRLGEVISGLGISDPEDNYANVYEKVFEAKTDKSRATARENASKRFIKAVESVRKQNLRGGTRMWSWSDNKEDLAPDVVMNMMQLELLGGGVQTYSKQLEGAEMVGSMGAYVNGSLMAKDRGIAEVGDTQIEIRNGEEVLKEDITEMIDVPQIGGGSKRVERVLAAAGSPVYEYGGKKYVGIFDDIVGIDAHGRFEDGKKKKGLFDLNNMYDRVGNIIVGMNDLHIRTMLNDARIFFCIPWHSSGAKNHILNQMFRKLGQSIPKEWRTDYTRMQEEKNVEDYKGKPSEIADFWERHKNEEDFACGIEDGVDSSSGTLSESQKHYRQLRSLIFSGALDGGKVPAGVDIDKARREIQADAFLSQVYDKVREAGGEMTSEDNKHVYPYEYWDEGSTYSTADINGSRYIEYCRRLGIIPKFSGIWGDNVHESTGDFTGDKGYWKLLIDRRMYDLNGDYQGMSPIDVSGFNTDMLDQAKTHDRFMVTQAATDEGVKEIVAKTRQQELERFGGNAPTVEYGKGLDETINPGRQFSTTRRGGEEDGMRDEARKRLDDPNASEYEKIAAAVVLGKSDVTDNISQGEYDKKSENIFENEDGKVNLQKNNEDELPERISQGEQRAQDAQIGSLGEVAIRFNESSRKVKEAARRSGRTLSPGEERLIEEREAERQSKEDGTWIPYDDVYNLGKFGPSGNESDTYISDDGWIYKENHLMHGYGIEGLLEKAAIHNQYFPETSYTLHGFTGFDGRSVYPILRQRYIPNAEHATQSEIDTYMGKLGFEKIEDGKYTNGIHDITDVLPKNVMRDSDGDIYVVDAEINPSKSNTGDGEPKQSLNKNIRHSLGDSPNVDDETTGSGGESRRNSVTRRRDEEYAEAVRGGDTAKAQQMVQQAAKEAMPNTKVVDGNGNPLVVYRGGEKINIFDPDRASKNAMYGQAFYTTPSYADAQGFAKERTGDDSNVQAVYLDVLKPWVDGPCESLGYPKEATKEQARELVELLTQKGLVDGGIILAKWNDGRVRSLIGALSSAQYKGVERGAFDWWHASNIVQETLKELGYDGVIGRFNSGDGMVEQIAVFSPTQIKSADSATYDDAGNVIPLSQRFDTDKEDLRFREKLAEGSTFKIEQITPPGTREVRSYVDGSVSRVPDGEGVWRIEGMAGRYPSREAAIDAFRERAQGMLWDISRDGNSIEVLGEGDAYEQLRGGSGAKEEARRARWQAEREATGRNYIDTMSERMGIKVRYVDDMSDAERAALTERQRKAKGWFNPETGEIFINLGNHNRSGDMVATLLHEAVGHKGLRDLFGEDFDTFLDNVWLNADISINEELRRRRKEIVNRNGNKLSVVEAQRLAVEEYLSELAEEGKFDTEAKASLWQRFKNWILDGLRKRGFNGVLRDEDLRYVLWKSYHNQLKQGSMIAKAEDVAMRKKLGISNQADSFAAEGNSRGDVRYGGDEGVLFRMPQASERDVAEWVAGATTDAVSHARDMRRAARSEAFSKLREFVETKGGRPLEGTDNLVLSGMLGSAMKNQRDYDKASVKELTDFAKLMIDNKLLDGMTGWEAKQMLTKIKNATGKENVSKEVDKLVDLMINHQMKQAKNDFAKMLKAKGTKVDQRGIVVQAGLDEAGQRTMRGLNDGISLGMKGGKVALENRISALENKLYDANPLVRSTARDELDGLYVARTYMEEVSDRQTEIEELKQNLKEQELRYKNGDITKEVWDSIKKATAENIREANLGILDGYNRVASATGYLQGQSAEMSKQWRESEKARKEEIQHDANRDMQGRDADAFKDPSKTEVFKDKVASGLQVINSPLGTFNTYLRYFGSKFAQGQGNLFNRFGRRAIDIQDEFFKNYRGDIQELNDKVSEIFGKRMKWEDLYSMNSGKRISLDIFGNHHEITEGSAVYLYMVNKMADGAMKLRYMGITEADIERIKGEVDPRMIEVADWIQEEYLPSKRVRYNETYRRMFGADMDNIENYFPLRINELVIPGTTVLGEGDKANKPSTITGGIIKRTRNNYALDTRVNAFSVVAEHLRDMEHWSSYAEFARDLNTLIGYKRFETQVKNMRSLRYGGMNKEGKNDIWEDFVKCCEIVTGDYRPQVGKIDSAVNYWTSRLAASNIAFRFYTAVKQLLSAPVYLTQARWDYLAKNIANANGSWKWAMENLPLFQERWLGRKAGDPILDEIDLQMGSPSKWKNTVRKLGVLGLTPNAFCDAVTVSIGARSIYETAKAKYLDMGYEDAVAEKKALQDAAISVNETQQSSQGMFTSVVQKDRTALSRMATIYRNASMGYERKFVQGMDSVRKAMFTKGWSEEAVRVTKDMLMREGLSEDKAERAAKKMVRKELWRGLADMAMFGSIAPFTWALGSQFLPSLLSGSDDDDDKLNSFKQAAVHALSGTIEGLAGGATFGDLADFLYQYIGEKKKFSDMRFSGSLLGDAYEGIFKKIDGKPYEAFYDLANMLLSMGVGVNPKTFVDMYVAALDTFDGDIPSAREFLLFANRLANVPQSALDKTYIEELMIDGRNVNGLSAEEMAQRYATYKRRRGAGYMNLFTDAEEDAAVEKKYIDKFNKLLQERLGDKSKEELEALSQDEHVGTAAEKALKKMEKKEREENPTAEDLRREAQKEQLKKMGFENVKKPESAGEKVYWDSRTYEDYVGDSILNSYKKKTADLEKAIENAGGSITVEGLKINKGASRVQLDALEKYYSKEINVLIILHQYNAAKKKYNKYLADPDNDPKKVMKDLREERMRAIEAAQSWMR